MEKKKSTFFTLTVWPRESFGLALCPRWRGAGRCPSTSGAVGTPTCGDAATERPGGTLQPQVDGARLGPGVWSVVLLEFFMRLPGGRAGGGFGGAKPPPLLSPSLVLPLLGSVPWKFIQGTWGVLLGGSTKSNPNAEAHRAGDGRELGTWQGRAQKAKGIDLL